MQISGYGNKANLNTNNQKQNPAFGSKVVIDDTMAKRDLRGDYYNGNVGSHPIPGMSTKNTTPKSNFTEKMLTNLGTGIKNILAKDGKTGEIKVDFGLLENMGFTNEFMRCKVAKDGKEVEFIAMPTIRNAKGKLTHSCSVIKNTLGAIDNLVHGEQPRKHFVPSTKITNGEKTLTFSEVDKLIGKLVAEKAKKLVK